jgi:hypothetical protein
VDLSLLFTIVIIINNAMSTSFNHCAALIGKYMNEVRYPVLDEQAITSVADPNDF